ncbi:MAG: DUF3800 domain-containing protein [Candidatus Nitrosopolaris sp.]
MYLVYLDESGSPPPTDPDPYYTLGGLVISERTWKTLNDEIDKIKNNYRLGEIHTRRIYRSHKKSPHTQYASNVLGDIYSVLAKSDLRLLCVSIDKIKEYINNPTSDIEFIAWELLIERLNICIDKLCKAKGVDEYGLIIMDEKKRDKDTRVRNYLKTLRQTGTQYQRINRIIEDPIFTPSDWRNLTQLADAIVFCAKSYLANDPFFVGQFLTIQDKFDKDSKGNINNAGFKVW